MLSTLASRALTPSYASKHSMSRMAFNLVSPVIGKPTPLMRAPPFREFTKSSKLNLRFQAFDKTFSPPLKATTVRQFNPATMNQMGLVSFSSQADGIKEVVVPQLAESLSEGDIKWDKVVGDSVTVDEVIGAVETDKTSIPIHSPAAGVVVELLVEDGSTVTPGQKILKLKVGSDTASSAAAESQPKKQDSPPQEAKPPASKPAEKDQQSAQTVTTSGPSSTVSTEDIKSQVASVQHLDGSSELKSGSFGARTVSQVKMNRMRQKIASRLKEAQNTYALLTTFNEIDMSNLIEMRQRYKDSFLKKHNAKLGFMSAFVKASAYALQDQPVVNAVIEGNQILYRDFIDISVAVASPKGLVVPVLRNVEGMNYADIEKTIAVLGEKARTNTLTVDEMEGGTFTISNGGVFGSLFGTPIVNPPQSAILGMHSINEKPVAVNGKVEIRPIMIVALTYDHRLIDGREAVTFLKKIKEVVEDPRIMLLDL